MDEDDDFGFELSNFKPDDTGLEFTVFFSSDPLGKKHRPRGYVRTDGKYYPFSLDEPFEWLESQPPGITGVDTEQLGAYVRLNRAALLAHWNGESDTGDLVEELRKV